MTNVILIKVADIMMIVLIVVGVIVYDHAD